MLVSKYNNFIFMFKIQVIYGIVFLCNILLKTNLDKAYEYYHFNTTMRDNKNYYITYKLKSKFLE